MWDIAKLKNGEWEKLGNQETLDAAQKAFTVSDDTFYFYAGELPDDKEAQNKIVDECMKANNGKISMAMIGVQISIKKLGDIKPMFCQGNCYCVVANGTRRCETYYCSANGFCWWVPCGMAC
ncbi:MAG: hypothetical protein C0508_01570 [Cyanobacteria bacterium PR.023]|nr:hypothetical protein [Cyanobacteria bacterium DS2.008]MBA4073698.1 hypothetical protein [Cyanobacteria bacterium PR.023]